MRERMKQGRQMTKRSERELDKKKAACEEWYQKQRKQQSQHTKYRAAETYH